VVLGHKKQWQFLKKLAESGKISHAYLFSGSEHLGKKKIALEFVNLINGKEIKEGHPDLILIKPDQGKEIQISQIKELIQKLSLKPYSASFKCAILDGAHSMNQEAQNCFLKTLEEPKGKTLLILITESPEMLFPTIRSRCEIIKFFPVKTAEIESYLESQGISKEKSQEIARFSLGRPGLAIDFLNNPQKLENYKRVIKELIGISSSSLAGRFQYAEEMSKSNNIKEILEIWLSYFRNVLLKQCSDFGTEHQYSFPRAKKGNFLLPPSLSLGKLKNIISQIQNTSFLISSTNVNPRLALEILMLDL